MTVAARSATYCFVQAALQEATERFITTGVAWHKAPDHRGLDWAARRKQWRDQVSILTPNLMRAYLRRVAKDLGKPFLHAVTDWKQTYASRTADEPVYVQSTALVIPKTKKLHPVAMALFLVAEEPSASNRWMQNHDKPVERTQNVSTWTFTFNGDVGHRIFDSFLDQCRNDPLFRLALKNPLPPQVTQQAA